MISFGQVIATRRDGLVHSSEELTLLATGAASGAVPDYQLAAWLMAAFLNPLTLDETAGLTRAMAESGDQIDLTGLPRPWVDKHSTGGVGDKTTLVVLPIVAACGLTVVKMSGKGLGITGGTVDKLAAIPGLRLDLSPTEMVDQAARIGIALTGQTANLAPADKVLYALRDTTGTVASMPLIVASILSKKIAGGAECVVLDVKCGSGAFMTTLPEAKELSQWLVEVGERSGLKVSTEVTDMSQPLGSAVGNALEVAEAFDVLGCRLLKPNVQRFRDLCVHTAGLALWSAGICADLDSGTRVALETLASGKAHEKAMTWLAEQGAQAGWKLPVAPVVQDVVYSGPTVWVKSVCARQIGELAGALGAGRMRKDDLIDPAVGIQVSRMVGEQVTDGDVIAVIHAASEPAAICASQAVHKAYGFSASPVIEPQLFL